MRAEVSFQTYRDMTKQMSIGRFFFINSFLEFIEDAMTGSKKNKDKQQ